MNVGSLFSGIGGFDLGFERAGMRTVWFCESEPFCQRVLAHRWPGVPCHPDVSELRGADVEPVDLLCGGFPCQDLSLAGKGAGIDGARSGLWSEFARLVGELRPRYVVVENVPALLGRGAGRVLGDLAALGYDAEWGCLPASAFGAPHRRDRFWLVAYSSSGRDERPGVCAGKPLQPVGGDASGVGPGDVAHPAGDCGQPEVFGQEASGPQADRPAGGVGGSGWWSAEPDVGRVADGVPARVDRLRSLGNSLVPQIAEWIGRRIMSYERGVAT